MLCIPPSYAAIPVWPPQQCQSQDLRTVVRGPRSSRPTGCAASRAGHARCVAPRVEVERDQAGDRRRAPHGAVEVALRRRRGAASRTRSSSPRPLVVQSTLFTESPVGLLAAAPQGVVAARLRPGHRRARHRAGAPRTGPSSLAGACARRHAGGIRARGPWRSLARRRPRSRRPPAASPLRTSS